MAYFPPALGPSDVEIAIEAFEGNATVKSALMVIGCIKSKGLTVVCDDLKKLICSLLALL